ncbi:MAG: hypothetical protein NVSMB30_10400 [Hymenobacter sp.]
MEQHFPEYPRLREPETGPERPQKGLNRGLGPWAAVAINMIDMFTYP